MIDSHIVGGRESEETTQRIYLERTAQGDQERTRLYPHTHDRFLYSRWKRR